MSGYAGNSDLESEHAMILNENALHAVRQTMYTTTSSAVECADCGDEIPEDRRKAVPGAYQCVACRSIFEKTQRQPTIKMLDRIL